MATPRTRRLIKAGDEFAHGNAAVRARNRLQKEARNLVADIARATKRLAEVNEEEEVISAAIEQHAGAISDAHKEPPGQAEDPA
jgi:hypothetical protein